MIESNDLITHDTKTRILDAAEQLFADRGFEATSLRLITETADVNLAAVNYHFHSKDALIEAVLNRRILPLNRERLRLLAEAGSTLEDVIRAFMVPAVRARQEGAPVARLIGRAYTDPCDSVRRGFFAQMREVLAPFTEAFQRVLPDLPQDELMWRIHFGVGVMAHTLAGSSHLSLMSQGKCDPSDTKGLLDRMVAFVAAGMRAPVPAVAGQGS